MTWSDEPRAAPEAGWYADPGGSGGLRYWDGATWTGHLTEPRLPAPAPAAAPPGAYAPAPPAAPAKKTPVWVWLLVLGTVGLVVLGVVAAVAIPAFRIARDAVRDDEAQLALRESHSAALSIRDTGGSFLAVTPAALDRQEPFVRHTDGPSTGPEVVSVYALDDRLTLALRSESGTCWVVRDVGTTESSGKAGDGQPCTAATVTGVTPQEF